MAEHTRAAPLAPPFHDTNHPDTDEDEDTT
jgi:hypothetical protein